MTFDPRTPVGPAQQDLHVETQSLGSFTNSLSLRLEEMQAAGISPALADELIARPEQFGAPGMVPGDFGRQYDGMRARLAKFIRFQQEAIEALGIFTRLSQRNFEALEADQLARLREIMDGWQERAAQAEDPSAGGGGGGRDMKL
ncbi:hypothetical protein [Streptomyces sp. NPDC049881]|uniref:hypothetical protein n=1 Tax=Streptomyces sp. NPDC049881 TaxID=3155778 RepID=UPI003434C46C